MRNPSTTASTPGNEAGTGDQAGTGKGRFRLRSIPRNATAGIGVVVALAAFCFIGPLVYHTNQVTANLGNATLPPGPGAPLGTDEDGFDILGRMMKGGQYSLELGFAVAIAATVLGTAYGAVAGWVGGITDMVMMRVLDTILALPALVLLLLLVTVVTPDLPMLILVLTVLSWLSPARLVRGQVLSLRVREYVSAAKINGGGSWWIIRRHLVPNALGVIVVSATFTVADAILMLSTLSFLGIGLPPPAADWGSMLTNGLNFLFDGYWWMVYPPALILVVTLIAFNLIGEAARDALDVRLR